MAKRKPKPTRNNNWIRLKAAIWKEYKEEGLYDWNSPRFNKLVSLAYQETGKKGPGPQSIAIAQGIQERIFSEEIGQTYQIPYYELGKTLEAFGDDTTYKGFKVITKFNTPEFIDEKFKVDKFKYDGSQFQELVRLLDTERLKRPMKSPPARINVEVDPAKKTIKLYVGEKAPEKTEGKGKKAKEPKAYKKIRSTPDTIKKIRKGIPEVGQRIKDLEYNIKTEKDVLIPILSRTDRDYSAYIHESTLNLREWNRELRELKKEYEDLQKALQKTDKGFVAKSQGKKKRK